MEIKQAKLWYFCPTLKKFVFSDFQLTTKTESIAYFMSERDEQVGLIVVICECGQKHRMVEDK